MSYLSKDLSVIAYANGYTVWHYTTIDPAADLRAPDYFTPAADMLCQGDTIKVNADTKGHHVYLELLVQECTTERVTMTQIVSTERVSAAPEVPK